MVRAKIACIRGRQAGLGEPARRALQREFRDYLALAESLAAAARPALVLMHGLSGSGKTTAAQAIVERVGAIRVRSDVERKRMHGLAPGARTGAGLGTGIYVPAATRVTYDRLRLLARESIGAGYKAVVDAAFLARAERDAFRALAEELDARFLIASCKAAPDVLRRRVAERETAMSDASEAGVTVLGDQLATQDPLDAEEDAHTVAVETATDEAGLRSAADEVAARLGRMDVAAALH